MSEPEFQPADQRLRIRLLILSMLLAALGAIGLLALDHYLTGLQALAAEARPLAAAKVGQVVRAILALLAAGGVGLSLYLGRTSWRTLRSERYPPPGARVLSDTRIRRGRPARHRGQAGLALAALTLLLTVAIAWRANQVFSRLLDPTLKPTPIDFKERPGESPASTR